MHGLLGALVLHDSLLFRRNRVVLAQLVIPLLGHYDWPVVPLVARILGLAGTEFGTPDSGFPASFSSKPLSDNTWNIRGSDVTHLHYMARVII